MNDPNISGTGGPPEGMWSSPQDLVGTVLADRYQVQQVIGDGGMGSVFLAEHVTLRKRVALKVLHPELCRDQTHVDRFLQEARAASMINHENIVDIVDFGPVPGGSVFFAMEFLEGTDLAGALRLSGRMPWPRVQNFMLQIVRALRAAHDKGIIHRDLKPANCFVITKNDGREFIKLLDFGIAKVTDAEHDKGLTRTGAVFGTAKYMAPEQACGEPADNRTDIYASAVLMYELLTGQVPFDGDNFMRVLSRHLTEPLTLPSTMAPDAGIPPMVESIVVKALSKKREDRYQSMTEFEEALLALGPDGTLLAGGMGGLAYPPPQTYPPSGNTSGTLPLDTPGHTQWMGHGQEGQGPHSQPPEGRGGTLLLDSDSAPPEFMNHPGPQGPTDWNADAAPGGTMMLDGMGQDVLSGPSGVVSVPNHPVVAPVVAAGSAPIPVSAETYPPSYGDTGQPDESSRKRFVMLALGGAVAAIGLGGLVAWALLEEPDAPSTPSKTPVAVTDPVDEPVEEPVKEPQFGSGDEPAAGATAGSGGAAMADDAADDAAAADDGAADDGAADDAEVQLDPELPPDDPPPTPVTNNRPKPPRVVQNRSPKDISRGFARAGKAAKRCGKLNGAIPGQSIMVEAAIKSNGEVLSASVSGPSRSTPLGKCVAKVVKGKARFVQSKQAIQTGQRHTYKM